MTLLRGVKVYLLTLGGFCGILKASAVVEAASWTCSVCVIICKAIHINLAFDDF